MIKLNKLNKYFFKNKNNEIHVINNVSLELDSKGLVAIHGPSGSGKTTLLNVIGGLDKVNSGEINFFEHELKGYKANVWDQIRNEHVGYIFQNYYLLPNLSVYENIRFVLKLIGIKDEEYIESRVNYVLNAVGMYPFRKKKALQLSGGQQQRVAIARALVKNPKVVIADEPTGNLDSKNTIEIMNIIKEISKEKLVILVTHEKKLADMYASRVINIEDGKIVDDVINEETLDHSIEDDAIYLKDFKHQSEVKDEQHKFNLYSNKELDDLKINVILQNDTLYLDVKGNFKKVALANESSGVIIKDAHYEKKTKEELTDTSFELFEIDHSKVDKDKKMIVSIKQTLKMAFEKLLTIGRKGKLMLASFVIAGAIIAFSVASLAALAIVRPESVMELPKGYVSLTDRDGKASSFKTDIGSNDDNFFVNDYGPFHLKFVDHKDDEITSITALYDKSEHAKKFKLVKGKYATNKNEIVITKSLADEFLEYDDANEKGIWSYEHIFKEKMKFADGYAQIVGIVDTEMKIIFGDELINFANLGNLMPVEAFDNIDLLYGGLPIDEQVLVPMSHFDESVDVSLLEFPYTQTIASTSYVISGVHNNGNFRIYTKEYLRESISNFNNLVYVYSSNPEKTINALQSTYGIEAENIYETSVASIKRSRKVQLATTLTTTLFLISFALVGFYFIIRSSLIERIYEIAVFRALGVSRKEVLSSFIVEIITITTITSFVGFSVASYGLYKAQTGLLGFFNLFYVNSLSFVLGVIVIYILNLIAGLLPIILLLRKTPARILSDYDI